MKKVLAFILVACVVMACIPVNAGNNDIVLATLRKTALPSELPDFCENFMKINPELSNDEAVNVIKKINQADAILGSRQIGELHYDETVTICELWKESCETCGYEASYNIKRADKIVILTVETIRGTASLYIDTTLVDIIYLHTLGDLNDDRNVNTGDATLVCRYSVELYEIPEEMMRYADTNFDGNVNTGDATRILQLCVGMIDYFI